MTIHQPIRVRMRLGIPSTIWNQCKISEFENDRGFRQNMLDLGCGVGAGLEQGKIQLRLQKRW